MLSVKVQKLVIGVCVLMVVQFVGDKSGLACSVRRKYGVVLTATVAEAVAREKLARLGASGRGRLP